MTSPFALNETHDPGRLSWVESANKTTSDYPLQNLPYGIFRTATNANPRIGVATGDQIFDLAAAADQGLLPASACPPCRQTTLNALMSAGPTAWAELRARLSGLLGADSCPTGLPIKIQACLVPQTAATLLLPAQIGDYTDFYASVSHASNVGA